MEITIFIFLFNYHMCRTWLLWLWREFSIECQSLEYVRSLVINSEQIRGRTNMGGNDWWQTVRIRRSVHSLANFLASLVRLSERSASSRDVEIKSRFVPVSPLKKIHWNRYSKINRSIYRMRRLNWATKCAIFFANAISSLSWLEYCLTLICKSCAAS